MEAMDIILAATHDLSYSVVNHPIYSIVGGFGVGILLLRFYCRLTCGTCDCNQDLEGKTVLITGATAGVGKATAQDLARRHARVILACRNLKKAERVAKEIVASTGNVNVVIKHLDLASFSSVRQCAEDVLKTEEKLDILINNAGIFAAEQELTEDGCETVLQSNHFGHFLLTLLLIDLLKKSASSRIINVASSAYSHGKLDLDQLRGKKSQYGTFGLYARSKLANVLFTRELAARLSGTGVTVNTLCPGMVKTDIIWQHGGMVAYFTMSMMVVLGKSWEEGAQTSIHLAVNPKLEKTTGKFFADCKEKKVAKFATDKKSAERLFAESEKVVGVHLSGKS